MCDIAEVLGTVLKMPVESIAAEQAPEYFGWLANLAANDLAASSAQTRQLLNWNSTGAYRTVSGVKRRGDLRMPERRMPSTQSWEGSGRQRSARSSEGRLLSVALVRLDRR